MSLITPDFGLLVWMTLIFGIVFFVLAKWGFPMITGSVEKRAQRIGESIKAAKEAEERLRNLAEEQSRMIEEARQEQSRILKEASASRDSIVEQAKDQARAEAQGSWIRPGSRSPPRRRALCGMSARRSRFFRSASPRRS